MIVLTKAQVEEAVTAGVEEGLGGGPSLVALIVDKIVQQNERCQNAKD
jgi:hypothetical protein